MGLIRYRVEDYNGTEIDDFTSSDEQEAETRIAGHVALNPHVTYTQTSEDN